MKKTTDILAIQDKEAVKNSFYRAPKKNPSIYKIQEDLLEVRTVDETVQIRKLEEVILYIITLFKFSPFWLIQQWFYTYTKNPGFDTLIKWINVGLVWAETTSMGVFIRPTRFLLDMFKSEDTKFLEIPFGMLNHNCSEQQLFFDITMGNPKSEMWNLIRNEETLPVYHPLNIKPEKESGTIVIREGDFRIGFKRYNTEEIIRREEEIQQQVRAGMKYTEEFSDFSRFPIVTFKKDTGEIVTQTPDVIIPIPRKEGLAQSYAIELELTPKQSVKYIDILENYKNNIKFGKLFYLCSSLRIARYVKEAYQKIGGLGRCELYILPFQSPAQRLELYNAENEQHQKNLIQETMRTTN